MIPDLAALRAVAEAAALAAGHQLRHRRAAWGAVERKQGRDVKVAADRESERLILASLAPTGLPVLSEEAGASGGDGRLCWLVDPLDGSFNYTQGVPLCCVSVALWDGIDPLLGVVYDFNRDELFTGVIGEGLFVNHLPAPAPRGDGGDVVATGFPVRGNHGAAAVVSVAEAAGRFRKVRMLGSAALSLAWVATGRMDCYRETGIMLWDVAGGLALVAASGGTFTLCPADDPLAPLAVEALSAAAGG